MCHSYVRSLGHDVIPRYGKPRTFWSPLVESVVEPLFAGMVTILEDRRNRYDLIEVFKMCNGLTRLKLDELFTADVTVRGTRRNSRKLAKFWCTRD